MSLLDPKPLWQRALARRDRERREAVDEARRLARAIHVIGALPPGLYCQACDRVGAVFKSADGRPLCRRCWLSRAHAVKEQAQTMRRLEGEPSTVAREPEPPADDPPIPKSRWPRRAKSVVTLDERKAAWQSAMYRNRPQPIAKAGRS